MKNTSELNLHEMEQALGGKSANQSIKATGNRIIVRPPFQAGPKGEIKIGNHGVA